MSNGEKWTSVFETYATIPEVMFYVPLVSGTYYNGDMVVYIGKAGGGTLNKTYTGERWYGEVRHYANGMGLDHEILHSGEFHIGHVANHFTAAKEYAKIVIGDGGDSWKYRLDDWASGAFEDDDISNDQ